MGMSEPLLRLDRVSKSFESRTGAPILAIDNVSLDLGEREFVSLIGPSGCGKSTVLRLAAGLAIPSSGVVTYRGKAVTAPDRCRGVVFQAYNSFPWLTVEENIAFGLDGTVRRTRDERVRGWLEATGLSAFADAYPKTLSGGMQQRLALARTMVVEPELLLLDEPFGALDEPTRQAMQDLLVATVKRASCAVIFVTHDIHEAVALSDRIVLLSPRPGRIARIYPRDVAYETVLAEFPR
jgi:ABC-type nitrate/sulfonate/bicarbonate transport system ATPase subunit